MSYTYHNLIGIEIGSGRVRIVKPGSDLKVKSIAFMEISESVYENGKLEYTTVLAQSIKNICSTASISPSLCAVSISSPKTIIRNIQLPSMNEENLYPSIVNEIKNYLKIDVESYIIDYYVYGTTVDNLLDIMVFVIEKDEVIPYLNALGESGFKVKYVDISENSIEKLMTTLYEKDSMRPKNFAIVNLDTSKIGIKIYVDNHYYSGNKSDVNAEGLIDVIKDSKGITKEEAIRYLLLNNVFDEESSAVDPELQMLIKNQIKIFSKEVLKILDLYIGRDNDNSPDCIYMTGMISNADGICRYIEKILGIKVRLLSSSISSLFENPEKAKSADYSSAIGATIRYTAEK